MNIVIHKFEEKKRKGKKENQCHEEARGTKKRNLTTEKITLTSQLKSIRTSTEKNQRNRSKLRQIMLKAAHRNIIP